MYERLAKYWHRGTGCINRARPDLWGSPSGNWGLYPENLREKESLESV